MSAAELGSRQPEDTGQARPHPRERHLSAVTDLPPGPSSALTETATSPQHVILFRGGFESSKYMSLVGRSINQHPGYEAHLFRKGIKGYVDFNVFQGEKEEMQDTIKKHADESGQPVILVGHSWGAYGAADVVTDPIDAFDPAKEIDAFISVTGAIGDIKNVPNEDEVRMDALYSYLDPVTHPWHPVSRLRSKNDQFHKNIHLPTGLHNVVIPFSTHIEPLYNAAVHNMIIDRIKLPQPEKGVA
jgi:hypothetical protein